MKFFICGINYNTLGLVPKGCNYFAAGLTLKQPDLLKIFELVFCTLCCAFFEYLFMFWLHRHLPLPATQALNSKQSIKGYERIIRGILRRSGYFNLAIHDCTIFSNCGPLCILCTTTTTKKSICDNNCRHYPQFAYVSKWNRS